jgi:hypothetical protein
MAFSVSRRMLSGISRVVLRWLAPSNALPNNV